jgi:hypothetical protein
MASAQSFACTVSQKSMGSWKYNRHAPKKRGRSLSFLFGTDVPSEAETHIFSSVQDYSAALKL